MKHQSQVRITGLTKNPPPARDPLIKDGYAICDTVNGYVFLYTVRSSRAESWRQFCKDEARAKYKKLGVRCVPVTVKEYDR